MGVLGWTPDVFWNALLRDVMVAIEGVAMANGAELPDDIVDRRRLQLAELERLMKLKPDG